MEAERLLGDSVEAAAPARDPVTVVDALTDLARLAATTGRLHRAAVLLGNAWAAGEGSFGVTPWPSAPRAELVVNCARRRAYRHAMSRLRPAVALTIQWP